jgi:hypothetical protein
MPCPHCCPWCKLNILRHGTVVLEDGQPVKRCPCGARKVGRTWVAPPPKE